MSLFRFGLHLTNLTRLNPTRTDSPDALLTQITEAATAAEHSGFDSIWVPDHVIQQAVGGGPAAPVLEPYTLLGALAATTRHAKLGALLSPVTFRAPALLAKTITTLDVLSGGRAILGIGAGWVAEEHTAYGLAFPPATERHDRLEEAVQICRAMLTHPQPASFSGRYYSITEAISQPRPVQTRIPILIGGSGEKRTLRTVARYGDACNITGNIDTLRHKLDVLANHCDAAGRDITEITTSTILDPPHDPDELTTLVNQQHNAGIHAVIILATDIPKIDTITQWGQALTDASP